MADSPLDALAGQRIVLVVGKGGVGKTTAAAGLALAWAERGAEPHLISTDPAHSLGDVLGETIGARPVRSRCHGSLTVEEFDAQAWAAAWLGDAAPALAELIQHGTLLDAEDAAGLVELSLPGIDEVMGALRLAELASGAGGPIVVDTAPMGHTLRLLDAGELVAGWLDVLRAMADRAAVVASSLTGGPVRLSGEVLLERLAEGVAGFRSAVLARAAVVVVYRNEHLVRGDTALLLGELERRALRPAALMATGAPGASLAPAPGWWAPWQEEPRGCDGLRRWFAALEPIEPGSPPPTPRRLTPRRGDGRVAPWLRDLPQRLLLFVGKGGVGKTSCAAAAGLVRAEAGRTVLFGTDAGGSLAAVLGLTGDVREARVGERLRLRRVDAVAEFGRLRDGYRDDVRAVFARLGLDDSLRMDRAILERLWNLAPPGIDELIALLEITASLERDETLVVDAAPTGHFLRLLAMPSMARDWTDALMRLFLRLHSSDLEGAAEGVLRFSRRLKKLTAELRDPHTTGAFAVTLDEPVVRAEMDRLRSALDAAHMPVATWIVNRAGPARDGCVLAAAGAGAVPPIRVVAAPTQDPPPGGVDGLLRFAESWEFVQ